MLVHFQVPHGRTGPLGPFPNISPAALKSPWRARGTTGALPSLYMSYIERPKRSGRIESAAPL
jgi:hypothetical protein